MKVDWSKEEWKFCEDNGWFVYFVTNVFSVITCSKEKEQRPQALVSRKVSIPKSPALGGIHELK